MSPSRVMRLDKNIHIRWYKTQSKVFPDYREVSGSKVGMRRLNRAKGVVKEILSTHQKAIRKEFEDFAKRKGGRVTRLDFEEACEKVDTAKMGSIVKPDESYYGITTNNTIWITAMKMSDELLIGTLLHEAIHDICYINGNWISEVDEHIIMRELGDNC